MWENKNESCAMTVDRVRVMMEEWQLATATRSAPTQQNAHLQNPAASAQQPAAHLQQSHVASAVSAQQPHVPSVSWQRPSRGRFKCNVDAGFLRRRTEPVLAFVCDMMMVLMCSLKQLVLMLFIRFGLAKLWVYTMLWNG